MKIRLDLAEILRISKLDWRDRGEEGREGEGEESYFVMVSYSEFPFHIDFKHDE